MTFSVTGLPAGAAATFSPVSVSTSGTTTLTVKTDASLAPGSYPLRITGTSGPVSHSADVTLVVNILGDFTIRCDGHRVGPGSRFYHLYGHDHFIWRVLVERVSFRKLVAEVRECQLQSGVSRIRYLRQQP